VCFFLKVMARRSKNRHSTLGTKRSPCASSRWLAISSSVMSGSAFTKAKSCAECASIRAERLSPPWGRASQSPVAFH
jgi:hypothetical protein